MNNRKNQSLKHKPIIPQSKIGRPGPTPYIQTEPDDTEYFPLDSLKYLDTNPNCDNDEGKSNNQKTKDNNQHPTSKQILKGAIPDGFDDKIQTTEQDVPQMIPKMRKTKQKQSQVQFTSESIFKKTPIMTKGKSSKSPAKTKSKLSSINLKQPNSPTHKNKSKMRPKKVVTDQEQRIGIHSTQKKSIYTRVIKQKIQGQQSPTRRGFGDSNDQIKEGPRTERLNNLKNDFSENTIKRTIHLQDSNSDEDLIQPKKIVKSPRSPKTVNSKARVQSKVLVAQKKISSKYTVEDSKKIQINSKPEIKTIQNPSQSGPTKGILSQKTPLDNSKKTMSQDSEMEDTEPMSMPVNKVKQNMHHNEKNVFMKQGGGLRVVQHPKLVQAKQILNPSTKAQQGRRTLVDLGLVDLGHSKDFSQKLSHQKLPYSKSQFTSIGQLQNSKQSQQNINQNSSLKIIAKETRVQEILSNMVPQQSELSSNKKNKIRASEIVGVQKTKTTKNAQMQKNKFSQKDNIVSQPANNNTNKRQSSYAEDKEQSKQTFRSVHIEEKDEFPSPRQQPTQQTQEEQQWSFALTNGQLTESVARMGRHLGPGIDTVLNPLPTSPNNQQEQNHQDSVRSGNNQDPSREERSMKENPFKMSREDNIQFQFEDRTQYHFNKQQEQMHFKNSERFSMPNEQKKIHFEEQKMKKNISSKSPFHGSRERLRALSINKEEVNQIVKQQFQSLPQQIVLPSKANISISATRPGQLNISHQLNSSRGNNSSRRDRSLTHHISQSNNANEFNPEEKKHRLDKVVNRVSVNRVRFEDNIHPIKSYDNYANQSVTSGDNCSSSRPRELSSLKQLRQQRKVSKSLLKNTGLNSNQSENNQQNRELLIENNTINLGNKIQDIQNQLNQLSELSAENRSQGAKSRDRLRSGSFKRTVGNALAPSEQFQAEYKINQNFGTLQQQHQRVNSMQNQHSETPQPLPGRSSRITSQNYNQSDLLGAQNNFNSTTKKVMINLSSNQIYDQQPNLMKALSHPQSNQSSRMQNQTAGIIRQLDNDDSQVTEEKSIVMFEGLNSFDRSQHQNRPTNHQGVGKPPFQHQIIKRQVQPTSISHQSPPVAVRNNSKSLKRQMMKHETMTEKLSREILLQSSQQRHQNDNELISPVPYGATNLDSALQSGPADFQSDEMNISYRKQMVEGFSTQQRHRIKTQYEQITQEQSLQATPQTPVAYNMRVQSERSLNRKLNSSSTSQTRLSRKGNLMFQKDKYRKSGMNINLNNQGLGMNFKQM